MMVMVMVVVPIVALLPSSGAEVQFAGKELGGLLRTLHFLCKLPSLSYPERHLSMKPAVKGACTSEQ